ncbi:MAG: hypothetical protein HY326_01025 [Chloroflexi bacterium]|nr:hypothetical protein [Chloroflexota bacterium]
MSISDEYQSLREELLKEYEREININTLVFTVTAVIIGAGVTAQKPYPIVFLLPLSILALLLFQLNNTLSTILTISVYIRVFIESNEDVDQHWETTINELRNKLRSKRRFRSLTEVIFARFTAIMGAICLVLSFLYSTLWYEYLAVGVAAILWLIICISVLRQLGYKDTGQFEKDIKEELEQIHKSTFAA